MTDLERLLGSVRPRLAFGSGTIVRQRGELQENVGLRRTSLTSFPLQTTQVTSILTLSQMGMLVRPPQ